MAHRTALHRSASLEHLAGRVDHLELEPVTSALERLAIETLTANGEISRLPAESHERDRDAPAHAHRRPPVGVFPRPRTPGALVAIAQAGRELTGFPPGAWHLGRVISARGGGASRRFRLSWGSGSGGTGAGQMRAAWYTIAIPPRCPGMTNGELADHLAVATRQRDHAPPDAVQELERRVVEPDVAVPVPFLRRSLLRAAWLHRRRPWPLWPSP